MKITAIVNPRRIMGKLTKMEAKNVAIAIDADVSTLAAKLMRTYMSANWKDGRYKTGHTARSWKLRRRTNGLYRVYNRVMAKAGSTTVAELWNTGTSKESHLYPKKSKKLFVPISKRAQRKKVGAQIPKNWVRLTNATAGKAGRKAPDYAFAKRVRAAKGTMFIARGAEFAEKELIKILKDYYRRI